MSSSETAPSSSHTGRERMPTDTSAQSWSSRCSQCFARPKEHARNLVVCIDGTSNEFGQNNTNVVKLFAKIDLESTHPRQFAYYSRGIGTRPKRLDIIDRMSRAVSDTFDMAVAWNLEEIVKDAYGWLARTYQEGDQIYLFGFSRGAYQVRVLAAMIYEIGLIRTPTDKQIGTAYDHYVAVDVRKPKTKQIAREFKNTFSWNLRVHFVGVWDTVSSVGLIRGEVFLSNSSSAAHACYFRHALALDERRVKFMPEYFNEMNSLTQDGKFRYVATPTAANPELSARDSGIYLPGSQNERIKEVWFAGSHSDVGGTNIPGKTHQAGNASLLWMRREAAASGLILGPTDIVWVPDDIDFGTSNSMTRVWRAVEYMPITHQISFSGVGQNSRRRHLLQPRRIIPGQKVHASILYANAYKPQASLGKGFDIPVVHADLHTELDTQFWDTGLFDDTAAQELVTYLSSEQGVAPIYLDRLLFMLRFKEGKQCIRNVKNWQNEFIKLIHRPNCAPLVRLITIVAYYEASCDPDADPNSAAQPDTQLPDDIFEDAKESLVTILAAHKHRDGPRVAALLRPLTKHQTLRERILTEDVLKTLMNLLDTMLSHREGYFGQAMDGLNCLLQYEGTGKFIIEKLGEPCPGSKDSRLSRILEVERTRLLTAALRMMMTLARIPGEEAKRACSTVKPRLRELAKKNKPLVGVLAVEILLVLYVPGQQNQLDIHNANVRTNLAGALIRFNLDEPGLPDDQDAGQRTLRQLFGLDETQLSEAQEDLLGELKNAVQDGNFQQRTAATLTLLKLCETPTIRAYLHEIKLSDVFVLQMGRKRTALLAVYALATFLKYPDLKPSIVDNELFSRNIVNMLRRDHFDDAVKEVEGFQIFAELMTHVDIREKIKRYDIIKVLDKKLGKGKSKQTRTSLICLDIFQSFDPDYQLTNRLLESGLEFLRNPIWKTQKAGVTILASLAQTEHGVTAIRPKIKEIVQMLLPESYLLIAPTTDQTIATTPDEDQDQDQEALESEPGLQDSLPRLSTRVLAVQHMVLRHLTRNQRSEFESRDVPQKPPSWMLGPACALRTLAQNKKLRECVRTTVEYGSLKHLFLAGTLVDAANTRPWRIYTPNRTDVMRMLDKMIKAVDGELSEDGLMSIGDIVLPHIAHWDRLFDMFRVWAAWGFTGLLGFSTLPLLLVLGLTTDCSVWVYKSIKRILSRFMDGRILNDLQLHEGTGAQGGQGSGGA